MELNDKEGTERRGLVGRGKNPSGPYPKRRLHEPGENHPLVGEVRGKGLLAAIELIPDKTERRFFPEIGKVGAHCRNYCFESGLVSRAIRDTMVLSPPLTITQEEVDEIVTKLKTTIDRTGHDFGRI